MLFVIAFVVMFLPVVIFLPTKIIHKENLPKRGTKAIVTSNHFSNLDVMVYDVFLCRKFKYMAKKELFKNKFAGFFVKALGGFPVDRENLSPSTFKIVMQELKSNRQIFIFPEGTRNKTETNELLEIKSGFLALASKGDCDITPMLLYRKPRIFRKNYIIVGKPFKLEGENPKRLTKEELEINLERYLKTLAELRQELNAYVEGNRTCKSAKK